MDKLQLAILTQWAGPGGILGRKRMQKVTYFLQQAGCPIEADYILHHYGPYSRDVAEVCDVMVVEKLLDEQNGGQFVYTLNPQTPAMIAQALQNHPVRAAEMEKYREQATELLTKEIWQLELGSTILYFYLNDREGRDWQRALKLACEYKDANPKDPASLAAFALAQKFGGAGAGGV